MEGKVLKPHENRVIDEHAALTMKIIALEQFFDNAIYLSLPKAEQERLEKQFKIMKEYSNILQERIEYF